MQGVAPHACHYSGHVSSYRSGGQACARPGCCNTRLLAGSVGRGSALGAAVGRVKGSHKTLEGYTSLPGVHQSPRHPPAYSSTG